MRMIFFLLVCSLSLIAGDELQYGIPKKSDQLVTHTAYSLGYNKRTKQADWVMHILTKEQLDVPKVKRSNDFRPDPEVVDSPTPEDYRNSGYDKGHMAPAGDFTYSKEAMSECFYMTNMSPQRGVLNQKRWNDLENWIRSYIQLHKKAVIITGPIFIAVNPLRETIGGSKVEVPEFYFKIIYIPDIPGKMFAFIMPNKFCEKSLKEYVVSVDEVERITEMDFFPVLPLRDQERMESAVNKDELP